MLLSPAELSDAKSDLDSLIDQNDVQKKASKDSVRNLITAPAEGTYKKRSTIVSILPEAEHLEQRGIQKANTITENMAKMRRLSSYIHDNYASPNIKDIE